MPLLLLIVDWIIADMLATRQSALGHVRYVLKDGLKWLPLYGWYFSQVMQLCEYMNVILSITNVKALIKDPSHPSLGLIKFLFQHGGIYVKRSAKFNEGAMRRKLTSQTLCGAPVSAL